MVGRGARVVTDAGIRGSRRVLSMALQLTARCLLLALFLPFSALDKVLNFQDAVRQARLKFPNRACATLLIGGGFGIEVGMSLAVLTGIADRLAACVLALYCIATAVLWKQFWRTADFKLRGVSRGRDTFWDFLKNLAVAGGFLLLAFGSDAAGVGTFLGHPFASSHPYVTPRSGVTP
jgi:putative oxidoreductase